MGKNLAAAKSGDHLKALEEARDTLADAIDRAVEANAGTVAQLAAQYRTTLAEIATLKASVKKVESDNELARRRTAKDNKFDATAI